MAYMKCGIDEDRVILARWERLGGKKLEIIHVIEIQLLNNIYISIPIFLTICDYYYYPEFYALNFNFVLRLQMNMFNSELIIFHPKSVLAQFPSTWLMESLS